MDKVRRHYIFTGRVQGVGFRYRASYAARGFGISGWVKNLNNGSVEMEAQGSRMQLNRMLELIQQDSYIMIDRMDVKDIPLKKDEHSFQVKGY